MALKFISLSLRIELPQQTKILNLSNELKRTQSEIIRAILDLPEDELKKIIQNSLTENPAP